MAIIHADDNNYEELIKEGFVIVDFYSDTCGPCKMLSPVLDELSFELPFLKIVKYNTTQNKEVARKNKVFGVPTLFFYKDGEKLGESVGYSDLEELKDIVKKYLY